MVHAKTKELRDTNKSLKKEIEERKRIEEKLKKLEKTKNEFVSVASHEFRTPLTILPRIFEKFQQGGTSYVKENRGAGLGLYIVKSLVELHHGEVWVNSKLGKGSTFSFSLPLKTN